MSNQNENQNATAQMPKEETKVNQKAEKLLDEFAEKYLDGFSYDKNITLKISGEEMKFGLGTNNILYDVDLTEEEFDKKVDFLHNIKTQDTSGVKFQYRVITKKGENFVVKYKSDSEIVGDGKVKRTREKFEV